MAQTSSRAGKARILIGAYDFSLQSSGYTFSSELKSIDYGVLQVDAELRVPGTPKFSLDLNGYFKIPLASNIEKTLSDYIGVNGVLVGLVVGTAWPTPIGYVFEDSFTKSLKVEAKLDSLLTVNGSLPVGDGLCYRGYVAGSGVVTSTGAIGGVDFGAAGAAGGKAFLHVSSPSGAISGATVKVQSSSASDFSGAADEGTFTFSAAGFYELDLVGVIGRYVRLNATGLGGATFSVVGICSVLGVTQN